MERGDAAVVVLVVRKLRDLIELKERRIKGTDEAEERLQALEAEFKARTRCRMTLADRLRHANKLEGVPGSQLCEMRPCARPTTREVIVHHDVLEEA